MTLAPDFAPRSRSALRPVDSDVHASLDLERLRAYRRELEAEEDRVGYWLRLVGAHITVVQAESTTAAASRSTSSSACSATPASARAGRP